MQVKLRISCVDLSYPETYKVKIKVSVLFKTYDEPSRS